jgi:hypothetical protein
MILFFSKHRKKLITKKIVDEVKILIEEEFSA